MKVYSEKFLRLCEAVPTRNVNMVTLSKDNAYYVHHLSLACEHANICSLGLNTKHR